MEKNINRYIKITLLRNHYRQMHGKNKQKNNEQKNVFLVSYIERQNKSIFRTIRWNTTVSLTSHHWRLCLRFSFKLLLTEHIIYLLPLRCAVYQWWLNKCLSAYGNRVCIHCICVLVRLAYYNETTINIHNHLNISTTVFYMYFKFCTRNKIERTQMEQKRIWRRQRWKSQKNPSPNQTQMLLSECVIVMDVVVIAHGMVKIKMKMIRRHLHFRRERGREERRVKKYENMRISSTDRYIRTRMV